jgi:hypothetical protein
MVIGKSKIRSMATGEDLMKVRKTRVYDPNGNPVFGLEAILPVGADWPFIREVLFFGFIAALIAARGAGYF